MIVALQLIVDHNISSVTARYYGQPME